MITFREYLLCFSVPLLFPHVSCSLEVIDVDLRDSSGVGTKKVDVCAGQVYLLNLIGLNDSITHAVEHSGSVVGFPDLPRWNFIRPHKRDLLLYGSYPTSETVDLQIITTDQGTFESTDYRLQLNVQSCRKPAANFEVEMKFMNYNVEDIFGKDILQKLETVMQTLWNAKNGVYASKIASVLDVGGRRPIDPRDKEGFIVRFAADENFSSELRGLEVEVGQLRNRIPCPKNYKRTSVEWRFREIGLAPDWCGFCLHAKRVIDPDDIDLEVYEITSLPPFNGPVLDKLPRKTTTKDIFVALLIPFMICLALLSGIAGTSMCLFSNDIENPK